MADDDDFDFDPAIAEAMGFAGFGAQPGKKRKFDTNDGFVDPEAGKSANQKQGQRSAKGANSLPLGARKPAAADAASVGQIATQSTLQQQKSHPMALQQADDSATATDILIADSALQVLRHGVKNERGDMVYFLPSFVEDPWKDLRPQ